MMDELGKMLSARFCFIMMYVSFFTLLGSIAMGLSIGWILLGAANTIIYAISAVVKKIQEDMKDEAEHPTDN